MVLILPEYSQRPYRYGMTLLCVGAMFNWLGLAENNAEPVRYIGVTLIAAGAMLICLAMCFWMKASHDPPSDSSQSDEQVHHIVTIHQSSAPLEKPPDYDSVTGCLPPCYEDAIRLNPSLLLPNISSAQDETDSQKPESDVPAGESQSTTINIPAPPYSAINIPMNITTNLKNDNTTNKLISTITNNSSNDNNVIITNEVPTNLAEESSQISNNDNFGSKVLRLSKRLLRGGGVGSSANKQHVSSQDGESSSTENPIINVITTNAPSSTAHSITTNTISDVVTSSNDLPSPSSVVIVDRNSSIGPSTSNLPVR